MKDLNNIKNIAVALGRFQGECPAIEKGKQGFNYKYADLPSIIETITPILEKNGLAFTQLINGDHENVVVSTFLIHCESGETLETSISGNVDKNKGNMTNIQAQGSVITYLRRYSLASMLGIVTDEDVDGSIENAKKTKSTPKPPALTIQTIIGMIEKETDKSRLDILKGSQVVTPFLKDKLFIDALKKQYDKLTPDEKTAELELKQKQDFHIQLKEKIKEINKLGTLEELTNLYNNEPDFIENKEFMTALTNRKEALAKLFKE